MTKKIDIKKKQDFEVVADSEMQIMDGNVASLLYKEFNSHREAIDYLLKIKKLVSSAYLEVIKNKYVVTCGVCSKPKSDKILQLLKSAGIG